jgi:diguanylate cyclase (GGDEF)-like protein
MAEEKAPRILVVDDEESLRTLLTEVLSDEGYHIDTAASGEEALSLFNNDPYPLVITDIRMGGMDGIELLQKLKARYEDTQVIVITSHASLETAVRALRSGAYDYLIKPFEDLDLITMLVNRALDKVRLIVENSVLIEKLKINNEELEKVNNFFRELAIRDGLTGLYNHRYFQENLSVEIARSKRHEHTFSLVFIDVDHFKVYNDTYGHVDGDQVLKTIGSILGEMVRNSDHAYRYGGEEFVLLLPETPKEGAAIVAEKVCQEVENYPFHGRETQPLGKLTISAGVATFPLDGETKREIIQSADAALYVAKANGRNMVHIYEGK